MLVWIYPPTNFILMLVYKLKEQTTINNEHPLLFLVVSFVLINLNNYRFLFYSTQSVLLLWALISNNFKSNPILWFLRRYSITLSISSWIIANPPLSIDLEFFHNNRFLCHYWTSYKYLFFHIKILTRINCLLKLAKSCHILSSSLLVFLRLTKERDKISNHCRSMTKT
jgi:hypothetical protein